MKNITPRYPTQVSNDLTVKVAWEVWDEVESQVLNFSLSITSSIEWF